MKINYEKLHELSFLNRENLYKEKENINFNYFSKRLGEIENDPFIGFVGSKYAEVKVRVLFLGKSNLNEIVSESVMPREETQNELEKQSMLSSIQIVESLQGR